MKRLISGIPVMLFGVLALGLTQCSSNTSETLFVQEPLPYAETALEPYMSARTLSFHYGKHHAAYVKNTNALLLESAIKAGTPEDVLREAAGKTKHQALFNQAAQAWNHAFFWRCLKPGGGGMPKGELLEGINASFGSFDAFKAEFLKAAQGVFGSGWVWLVKDKDRLVILTTKNADTPLSQNLRPLFTVDVWEHSYYLDYQNKRGDFVKALFENLANWDYAASLLGDDGK